ncbi:N-formylglutamate amidohydrolase [Pseudohalioglobus lutimaris]|uniref:N-formylglutamate amidohydrolase n=1 Tax=Pseudohalioglobus lutimaris TaxID=1737061 RepID=A0A2N5WXE8_9GAMM|nr:N-formylglutamate amidohydrolase [Pseudohalioglobus lutimaris]PLW66907.1 hypothetical protein C0039_19425 [Pseudohalioglobus lutimaris]
MYPETILPIVAHIPHAGTQIPENVWDQFTVDRQTLWRELVTLTDWYTDELYGAPAITRCQTPINRLVVDLERYLDDDKEPKARAGQGVIYTHDCSGNRIRKPTTPDIRQSLIDQYYRPWHLQLDSMIAHQITRWGYCLLLDCHSFPNMPFANEPEEIRSRPDICIGTSAGNTPEWLLAHTIKYFGGLGYSVEVDFPYSGCLVPKSYHPNKRVPALMIEINRRLYIKDGLIETYRLRDIPEKLDKFNVLRKHVLDLMLFLVGVSDCAIEDRAKPPMI